MAGKQPSGSPAALWQLLFAALPESLRAAVTRETIFVAAGESTGARNLDIIDLICRRKVLMQTLHADSVPVEPAFDSRLKHCLEVVPPGPSQDRLIRWEIIKMSMCFGCIVDGCITDTAEGREIRIPLKFTIVETTEKSTQLRMEAFNHPQVQAELFTLWNVLCLRGGVTLPVYYGLCKSIHKILLPHFSDREIHQLITTEVEIDLPDQSVDSAPMTFPQFLRWIASITLIWLETHTVAEVLSFVQGLSSILQQPVEVIDLDFYVAYGRKDPSMLVPTVPARVINKGLKSVLHYAREQLILTARIRFGSLLSDAPITVKPRIKKRTRHSVGRCIGSYLAPATESLPTADDNEEALWLDSSTAGSVLCRSVRSHGNSAHEAIVPPVLQCSQRLTSSPSGHTPHFSKLPYEDDTSGRTTASPPGDRVPSATTLRPVSLPPVASKYYVDVPKSLAWSPPPERRPRVNERTMPTVRLPDRTAVTTLRLLKASRWDSYLADLRPSIL